MFLQAKLLLVWTILLYFGSNLKYMYANIYADLSNLLTLALQLEYIRSTISIGQAIRHQLQRNGDLPRSLAQNDSASLCHKNNRSEVQLVRTLACHARGEVQSFRRHFNKIEYAGVAQLQSICNQQVGVRVRPPLQENQGFQGLDP